MKRLLFIMDTLPLGGISKSLLSLLNELGEKGRYKIDLLLMKKEGMFLPMIPQDVNLHSNLLEPIFRNPHPKYILRALLKLPLTRWPTWFSLSLRCTLVRLRGGLHRHIQELDMWIGKHTPALPDEYDAAIAYQGGRCIYYLIEKIRAKIKIGYVHSDYSASEADYMLKDVDQKYFPQLNWLVTISAQCAERLKTEFPNLTDRIRVVENVCSPSLIKSMANEKLNDDEVAKSDKSIKLLTLGRLDLMTKGLDLAVETALVLKRNNIKFKWYFVGDGDGKPKIVKAIKKGELRDYMFLLGAKSNPYPYIKLCDIYVHPSRFEGKSVALDEVKILCKPIVATNFPTVYDQLENRVTALICQMSPHSIAESIMELINDRPLAEKLIKNLKERQEDQQSKIDAFENLISPTHD